MGGGGGGGGGGVGGGVGGGAGGAGIAEGAALGAIDGSDGGTIACGTPPAGASAICFRKRLSSSPGGNPCPPGPVRSDSGANGDCPTTRGTRMDRILIACCTGTPPGPIDPSCPR